MIGVKIFSKKVTIDLRGLEINDLIHMLTLWYIKKIIYASSASVYGNAIFVPMTEEHPFNNKNFYGSTKIASETLIKSFCKKRKIEYTILRYMNVYGESQDARGAYIAVIVKWLNNPL